MIRRQAFKFELMPTGEQLRSMRRFAGSCRFVYNKALAMQNEKQAAGEKFVGYVMMAAKLPLWKRETGTAWLREAPSQALQQTLKDLECAYKNFFAKRAAFPRFKRKGSGDSFRYPDPKQTSCTKPQRRLSTTTHSSASKIYRYGTCPGPPEVRRHSRGRESIRKAA